ncbi:MAG: sugar ABC transporter permease [Clostridia bacterium]|nr:sugar ABC transporter permease [Clostridia bacterium]NLF20634.1 sugar ABC transporter permease [Clostridiaceae bacterium]
MARENLVSLRRKSFGRRLINDWQLYLLLLPGLIWFLVFAYRPLAGLQIAFYDYNVWGGLPKSDFVGLENFTRYLSSPDFKRTAINTVMLAVWQLGIVFPFSILLAMLVTESTNRLISRMTMTVTFLPYFISAVVVAGMVVNFTSPSYGIVNLILEKMGLESVYFMTKPNFFRPIYTIMILWMSAGYNSIVYIAAIMGIDSSLYEAATVDGAGRIRRLWHVTLPGILPTIMTMLLLNIGKMIRSGYETIILLYQPTTLEKADTIATYAYRLAFDNGGRADYGLATAVGLFEAVVALLMVAIANRASQKLTSSSLW